MAKVVPEPVAPDGEGWRVVQDPRVSVNVYFAELYWRCRAFELEYRWAGGSPGWRALTARTRQGLLREYPKFQEFWRDLFLNP